MYCLYRKMDASGLCPAGGRTKNESFADAAGGELEEETTLVKGLSFLYHVIGATTVHHVFAANIAKTAVAKPGKEIERCQWFSLAEMDEIVVSTTTRQSLRRFLPAIGVDSMISRSNGAGLPRCIPSSVYLGQLGCTA